MKVLFLSKIIPQKIKDSFTLYRFIKKMIKKIFFNKKLYFITLCFNN